MRPVSSRSFAPGSVASSSDSPIRKASKPLSRRSNTSRASRIPLSATLTASAGRPGSREIEFWRSTSKVRRSRLLMPTSSQGSPSELADIVRVVGLDQRDQAEAAGQAGVARHLAGFVGERRSAARRRRRPPWPRRAGPGRPGSPWRWPAGPKPRGRRRGGRSRHGRNPAPQPRTGRRHHARHRCAPGRWDRPDRGGSPAAGSPS